MEKRKYIFGAVSFIIILFWSVSSGLPDDKLHVVFCDVGQGDATLIIKGEVQVLIDGGPSDQVLTCLSNHMPFWDKKLELVFLTHPEADHINGLVSVFERYSVKHFVGNSILAESGAFNKLREEVVNQKIPVLSPKEGEKLRLGKLEFDILWPAEKIGNELVWTSLKNNVLGATFEGNLNRTAIVSKITYGQFEVLVTGDIGAEEEKEIDSFLSDIDILKVAHHGSKYSTTAEFLNKIVPELAVISVGAKNSYGHPATETLERLKSQGTKILRTDLNGEIEVVSDGVSWYTKD